ncbi:MAG: TerB family tellurite resistance protein [Endozoicomonadaceae bacterium]|nr:TerB family tellurite resistance protein [Endozoicomonadaceae bacterium]
MLLDEIKSQIQSEGYFVGTWDVIDETIDFDFETTAGLIEFNELLNNSDLECLPKIVNGSVANIEKSLNAIPIVIFNKGSRLKRNNSDIRYALLVGKIAAAMAKVDGEVNQEEIQQIRQDIYTLSFLSESEKYRVFIRSVYALHQKSSKEEIMQDFALLSTKAKKQALNIAKDIVIADHYINRNERLFLYEFYRLSDLPTNTVYRDLRTHAKNKNVVLESNDLRTKEAEPDLVVELDDSFDQMLAEFENF